MTDNDKRSRADIEWENRTLCSDESCIGVIGPDGKCKECGKPFEGEFTPVADSGEQFDFEDDPPDYEEDCSAEDQDSDGDLDWESRTLCSDESCIGVIGPDGRCKECGKPLVDADT